jgi:ParB family chromosome partitioning protein
MAIALIENIQREDLNPIEEARALSRLIDEFTLTHQEAADAVGRSRAAVSNLLRLLELAAEARALLENGDLEMGHARALLALPPDQQGAVARQIAAKGLSVRETERLVRRLLAGVARKQAVRPSAADPDTHRLQDDLAERLGAVVRIQHSARGRGRLVIEYGSLEELDGILAHIR